MSAPHPARRFAPFLLLGLLIFGHLGAAHAASARDDLAKMVQLLGYGGAIHNFKNYVLRGDHREEYEKQARKQFESVLILIARLEGSAELNRKEQQGLADIKAMVTNYLAGLKRIQALFEKGWRLEDIDRVVIVDDGPALIALQQLRAKWQWSDWEQVEYHLGYGGAIHHFKNYVLRHSEVHHTQALEHFLAAQSLLTQISSQAGLPDEQAANLATVARVSSAYVDYLALIGQLIRAQRPTRQIDLAVKVNDRPALAAIDKLRAK